MEQRQDGWYYVRWPHFDSPGATKPGPWRPSTYDAANDEWVDQGLRRRRQPSEIGPRIPSAEELKAQELEVCPGELMELRRRFVVHEAQVKALEADRSLDSKRLDWLEKELRDENRWADISMKYDDEDGFWLSKIKRGIVLTEHNYEAIEEVRRADLREVLDAAIQQAGTKEGTP